MMFYRSDDLTNSVKKSWRSVVSHPDRSLPSGHQKTQILTLYLANAPTLMRCNFLEHTPKIIIFGTHNLQTFIHNTLINKLLLICFYLFNNRPKLHHWKWQKSRITLPVNKRNVDALFSICSLRDDNVITSKPTWKLQHANSILEYFKYFCQMSWKSILIVLSYTVSKLVHIFWDTVYRPI